MNRSAIREQAFKLIYSLDIQRNENLEEQIELYIENNMITEKRAKEYIRESVKGVEENKEAILKLIEKNLKSDWKIDRISKIDIAILKLAIYEMNYMQTPFKIIINEVVNMAKKYGEDSSPAFINGVLAKIVEENNSNSKEVADESNEQQEPVEK